VIGRAVLRTLEGDGLGNVLRKRRSVGMVAGAGATALLAWLSVTMLTAPWAIGTTADTVGLPAPEKLIGEQYMDPYVGRLEWIPSDGHLSALVTWMRKDPIHVTTKAVLPRVSSRSGAARP
jgi:hypothetical protein